MNPAASTSGDNPPDHSATGAELALWRRLHDTPELFEQLASLKGSELQKQSQLRKTFDPALVTLAMTVAECRRKAVGKYSQADRMWFDRVGLEQSTAEVVAAHKAKRFPHDEMVFDFCSGIGGDAIMLAERGPVTLVDRSALQLQRAFWNAEVYGRSEHLTLKQAEALVELARDAWFHIDPDRRPGGRDRSLRIEDMSPDLAMLQSLMAVAKGGAVKLSPASNFGGKFPDAEIELISLHGECKEATIWFGDLAQPGQFRATSLPSGETLVGHPLDAMTNVGEPMRYLFDPDPAIVRAGLVDVLAEKYGLVRLDAAEEYLTGDEIPATAFVRSFEIDAVLSNNEKDLRAALRERNYGPLEIKCRHVPVETDRLQKRLPVGTGQPAVVFIARLNGRTHAILARRTLGLM